MTSYDEYGGLQGEEEDPMQRQDNEEPSPMMNDDNAAPNEYHDDDVDPPHDHDEQESFQHPRNPEISTIYGEEYTGLATAEGGASMLQEPFTVEEEPIPMASRDYGNESLYHVENANESTEEEEGRVYTVKGSSPLRESNASRQQASFGNSFTANNSVPSTPSAAPPMSSASSTPRFRNSFFRNTGATPRVRVETVHDNDNTENNNSATTPTTPKSPKEAVFTPQFKELHDKTIRRRQNLQKNKMDLERRLASITSKLANLTMEREGNNCGFLRDSICIPMEEAAERIALEHGNYGSSQPLHHVGEVGTKHWLGLTAKLSQMETEIAKQVHVTAPQMIREKLDQPYNVLTQELTPTLYAETSKSEKREGSMMRQFEDVAATARRRFHEEHASRHGAFEIMRQQLLSEAQVESDPERIEEAIAKVRALRAKLEQERVERRMRDEHLKVVIEQEVISMRRAMLEATGGDDFGIVPADQSTTSDVRRAISYR